jgi:hypothetical protein
MIFEKLEGMSVAIPDEKGNKIEESAYGCSGFPIES